MRHNAGHSNVYSCLKKNSTLIREVRVKNNSNQRKSSSSQIWSGEKCIIVDCFWNFQPISCFRLQCIQDFLNTSINLDHFWNWNYNPLVYIVVVVCIVTFDVFHTSILKFGINGWIMTYFTGRRIFKLVSNIECLLHVVVVYFLTQTEFCIFVHFQAIKVP